MSWMTASPDSCSIPSINLQASGYPSVDHHDQQSPAQVRPAMRCQSGETRTIPRQSSSVRLLTRGQDRFTAAPPYSRNLTPARDEDRAFRSGPEKHGVAAQLDIDLVQREANDKCIRLETCSDPMASGPSCSSGPDNAERGQERRALSQTEKRDTTEDSRQAPATLLVAPDAHLVVKPHGREYRRLTRYRPQSSGTDLDRRHAEKKKLSDSLGILEDGLLGDLGRGRRGVLKRQITLARRSSSWPGRFRIDRLNDTSGTQYMLAWTRFVLGSQPSQTAKSAKAKTSMASRDPCSKASSAARHLPSP